MKNVLLIFLILILVMPTNVEAGGDWWNSSWNYYKAITINQTMVNQSISNAQFPLLVSITDIDLRDRAHADGDDIVFIDSTNTTQLEHEIELWNSATGELVAWVNITDIINVSSINMYYNNSGATNTENSSGVWDDNYVMVQHMGGVIFEAISNLTLVGREDDVFPEGDRPHAQGIASDGTYLYITDDQTILKLYKSNYTEVLNNTNANTSGTSIAQVNSVYIYGDLLYIGANNYDNASKLGYVKVFYKNNLTYKEEFQVKDHYSEGCSFHNNSWWVVYYDWAYVSRYDTDWVHMADYSLQRTDSQGCIWINDLLYVSTTSGANYIDVYKFDSTLSFVKAMTLPATITDQQGLGKEPDENLLWLGEINYNGQHQNFVNVSFDYEDTANKISGSTVNNYTGTYGGSGAMTRTNGTVGKCISFDGSTDYIETKQIGQLGNFSISFIAKPDIVIGQETCVLSLDLAGWNDDAVVGIDPEEGFSTDNKWGFTIQPNDGLTTRRMVESTSDATTSWQHIWTTNDGGTMRLYVNGTEVDNLVYADLIISNQIWFIGSRRENEVFFDGLIDEVRHSNTHRGAAYIETDYNCTMFNSLFISLGAEQSNDMTAPIITLLSQTPSTICQNCTGNISIEYGISHNSAGLNNTSISFIYRDYDHDLSDSNHSIRPPINNLALEWNYDGRILRGANRNESLNFENNATITGGDTYSWSGLDENNSEMSIVYVNDTYTKVYINSTIHRIMPQMHYIDRSEMQEAPKTTIAIHKTQNILVKFWNFEIFKGNTDFIGVGYTDTTLNSNSALWPSDANPIDVYYVSSGYDPTTGGDPITSGYAVYMLSLNSSEWTDHDYSPHENSSYIRGFIDNNLLELYINTTNISYLYYTSNTPSSKAFHINVTDVATGSNVSFANTNVLWAGDNVLSQQSYTPNIWFAFMKTNMSFDHKLYVADNNDQWANSTMNRTTIAEALFPPTKSTFHSFHNGFTDYDMNGTYSGIFDVQIGAGSDPDGGNTTQNLSLHYGDGTYISTLANTTCNISCIFMNVSFNSTPYYSTEYNYTMRIVGTDDEGDTATTWLNVNFSLQDNIYIVSGSVYDEYNKGLSSATITLDSDTTTTASDGTFIFTGIADGTYKLSTFKDPYGTLSTTISVSGAHVTGQDFYYTDKTGGGAGATGPIQIVDVLDVDGEIIGKAIAIGKLGEAWFTIDLVSISNLLTGKDTKNVWNILAIFSIFLMVIGFFDKSKTTRGEFLLVAGLIIIIIFSINRFDLFNLGKSINYSFDIWNGVIIVSAVAFIYGFFFDKSKTNRREFLLIFGFVGIGLYAIYQSKLAIVIGFG